MKKIAFILLLSTLICGCSEANKEEVSKGSESIQSISTESVDTTEEAVVVMVDEDTSVTYDSVDVFKCSSFYSNIKAEGRVPYLLEYDDERYTFKNIISDLGFYTYILYDNTEQRLVSYEIIYNTPVKNISEHAQMFSDSLNEITSATNEEGTYNVFLSSSKYNVQENYTLSYLPSDGYQVTLKVGDNSSKEDILSYFDDFKLIADNS